MMYDCFDCDHSTTPQEVTQKECRILEGHFRSPFADLLPGIMPKEVEVAKLVSLFS